MATEVWETEVDGTGLTVNIVKPGGRRPAEAARRAARPASFEMRPLPAS